MVGLEREEECNMNLSNNNNYAWRHVLMLLLRTCLGLLFVLSSIHKFVYPHIFLAKVYDYEIVGENIGLMIACVLPMCEFIVGMLLLCGFFQEGAAVIASLMLLAFCFAQTSVLWRGLKIGCGCFGIDVSDDAINYAKLARIYLLCALSLLLSARAALFRSPLKQP